MQVLSQSANRKSLDMCLLMSTVEPRSELLASVLFAAFKYNVFCPAAPRDSASCSPHPHPQPCLSAGQCSTLPFLFPACRHPEASCLWVIPREFPSWLPLFLPWLFLQASVKEERIDWLWDRHRVRNRIKSHHRCGHWGVQDGSAASGAALCH